LNCPWPPIAHRHSFLEAKTYESTLPVIINALAPPSEVVVVRLGGAGVGVVGWGNEVGWG
jgi:hypothetical protein